MKQFSINSWQTVFNTLIESQNGHVRCEQRHKVETSKRNIVRFFVVDAKLGQTALQLFYVAFKNFSVAFPVSIPSMRRTSVSVLEHYFCAHLVSFSFLFRVFLFLLLLLSLLRSLNASVCMDVFLCICYEIQVIVARIFASLIHMLP